jgi:hypothetical protein
MSDTDTVDTDTVDTDAGTPPPPVDGDEDDGDDWAVLVSAAVHIRGRRWSAEAYLRDEPDDAALAEELINVLTAVSAIRGTNVWFEVQQLMRRRIG